MKDKLNQKGWKDMAILLDKEMPVAKKSNRKAIIFFWLTSLIIMLGLIWFADYTGIFDIQPIQIKDNQVTNSSTIANNVSEECETFTTILSESKAQLSSNENESSVPHKSLESKSIQKNRNLNTVYGNQKSRILNQHKDIIVLTKTENQISVSNKNSINPKELNPVIENNEPIKGQPFVHINPLLTKNFTQINSDVKTDLTFMASALKTISYSNHSLVDVNPKIHSKMRYGIDLLGFKNIYNSGKLGAGFSFSGKRILNDEYNLRFSTGLMVQNMDYKLSLDTVTNETTNLDYFINQNSKTILFEPNRIWQWQATIGIERAISKNLYLLFDVKIPYIFRLSRSINEFNSSANESNPLSALTAQKAINYNRWDIQPTFGLDWELNKNFSLEAKYSHGTKGLIKTPELTNSKNLYYSNIEFSCRFLW